MALTKPEIDRRYRLRLRLTLIAVLGGCCEWCGETDPDELEADHLETREWRARDLWSHQRTKKYIEEAIAGKVQLLCRSCNAMKGEPLPADIPF